MVAGRPIDSAVHGVAVGALGATVDPLNSGGINDPVETVESTLKADGPDAGGGTTIPGGGAATARGSSINSNGKSGSCSWKGEAGTPAKPFGGFAAGGVPLAVTPTGRETFLVPVAAPSDGDALRGAATAAPLILDGLAPLIETPTGREALAGVLADDDEDATPGRWAAALVLGAPAFAFEAAAAPPEPSSGTFESDADADAGTEPADALAEPGDATAELVDAETDELPGRPGALAELADLRGSKVSKSTSGSTNSSDPVSVGTIAESGRASEALGPEVGAGTVAGDVTDASALKSINAPCASKSSSVSIRPFDDAVGDDVGAAGVDDEGRAPAAWEPAPATVSGSSTGRSAKGSKVGRDAASIIVFGPKRGELSSTYPAMPWPGHLGDGSQISGPAESS